ncbi:uncharacterized protein LOC125775018 [Anopheles funestus]|uniref:uncharacterized protein LOC125775018 n=1 Tax=Anopheles funestus TaxID=62324 RepID=UPI0020C70CCF|nr:uncharacterized protein LOC125775018 [Anopheles funestus]
MAVKSKNQTPTKKNASAVKKAAGKKKDLNSGKDDVLDSEKEDDDMMELEDDESIAPDVADSDDDEEMEDQPPKKAKKTKLAKDKSVSKELKGKGAEPKEKKAKNGTKQSDLALKAKDARSDRLKRTVCLKHVKPIHTDKDIVNFFSTAGKCTVIRRVRSKALAMVLLESVEQAEKAIDLNGRLLNGHSIVIEPSKFLDRESALKEKKKLRTKKKKLERRKMAKQQAAGVEKKEPSTVVNGKGQKKKDKTNKKEGSKKQGKGKEVAKSAAIAQTSKPAKPAGEAKGTKKKESKGKKVTK